MSEEKIFKLEAPYQPTGDQPQAIEQLVKGFKEGNQCQTLLGATGSGKTFTMANVIAQLNRPTLVIAHNKTLAAQLYGEFKEFFPDNSVELFMSYYDYYQPEAYVPSSDTYIAKDSSINDEIDKLRHSATAALSERRDVIIVASVSCIYGLGSPIDYQEMVISLRPGMIKDRDEVVAKLIEIQYDRNDMDFKRGTFRVRGDVLEIFPAVSEDYAIRVEFFGDEVERITEIDVLTGEIKNALKHVAIFPASHYVVSKEALDRATKAIEEELEERVRYFKGEDNNFERHAYYRISGDLLKPGELTVTLPVVKRQDLSVSAGGDFGVQIELFYKKPGRYKDDIYDCPDSLLYFPVPAGSGKYQQVTQTFVLPDNVACAFLRIGGTHFSGECWVEAPRVVQNK